VPDHQANHCLSTNCGGGNGAMHAVQGSFPDGFVVPASTVSSSSQSSLALLVTAGRRSTHEAVLERNVTNESFRISSTFSCFYTLSRSKASIPQLEELSAVDRREWRNSARRKRAAEGGLKVSDAVRTSSSNHVTDDHSHQTETTWKSVCCDLRCL